MKIKISYTDRDGSYIANNLSDCKSKQDRLVYETAKENNCPIAMGITVGEPVR